jgi:serine/threonine protein phosphatase PrpC
MKFTTYTDKGGRTSNDDYAADKAKNGIYCFAVADGLGKNGDIAARMTVNTILSEFEKSPLMSADALKKYITEAQKALLIAKSEKREYDEMASTVAVLLTNGSEAVYGYTGDTRVYILNHSHIKEISEDHSAAFEQFMSGSIEYGNIRYSSERHKLRRAIGDRISWEPTISDVFVISSAYSFLICTDGFWNLITEKEIESARRLSSSSKKWLEKMLNKLMPRMKYGSDNLSATAICIQKTDVL